MIEQIDYDSLIDPLCIPTIKYLRETLGVDTLFCCQGKNKEDLGKPCHHSSRGYISAVISPESEVAISKIYELEAKRWKHKNDPQRNPKFEINKEKGRVTFWMARRLWNSSDELRQEWDTILNYLQENE